MKLPYFWLGASALLALSTTTRANVEKSALSGSNLVVDSGLVNVINLDPIGIPGQEPMPEQWMTQIMPPRAPDLIFSENFEDEAVINRWVLDSDNEGRIEVVDHEGSEWLQMDDHTDNAVFSQNIATHTVDIGGLSRLQLDFDFARANDEWHATLIDQANFPQDPSLSSTYEDYAFDGLILRAGSDDKERALHLPAESLFEGQNSINLGDFLLLSDEALEIGLYQYDNFSAPSDGLLWDNIQLTGYQHREIYLEPTYSIVESAAALPITVIIDPAPEEEIVLMLSNSNQSSRSLPPYTAPVDSPDTWPSTAVYPAGASFAQLDFPVFYEDETLSGDRILNLAVSDGVYVSDPFQVTIQDDEPAGLELAVPESIEEDGIATFTVFSRNLETRYSSISVQLDSSDSDLLDVPSSVRVQREGSPVEGGGASALVDVAVPYDPALTGDRTVTITASFGEESISSETVILDRNSLVPQIEQISGTLAEGSQPATFRVFFKADLSEPATIALQSSDPQAELSDSSITIDPESGDGTFSVSALDDSLAQGNRDFTIQAEATFASGGIYQNASTFTILDNEIAGFSAQVPDMLERGATFDLDLIATTADGHPVTGYQGTVRLLLRDPQLPGSIELATGLRFSEGELSATIDLPADASGSTLVAETEDGVSFPIAQVVLYGAIDFATNSLTYDTDREQFYAISGGEALAGHLHSITPINPRTLEIGTGIFIGNHPTISTLTFDNAYLYVGQRNGYTVSRLNLDSLNVDQVITLTGVGTPWTDYSYFPMQILTFPNDPQRIVVSQDAVSSSYTNVVAYQNGTPLPDHLSHEWLSMVNGAQPDIFYALYGASLRKYQSTPTGFTLLEEARNLLDGASSMHIDGQGDVIVSNAGHVIDGTEMKRNTRISLRWENNNGYWSTNADVVETDLARSRIYFAKGQELLVYEAQSYTLVERFNVPVTGDITELVRYGKTGLAIATDNAEVLFIESPALVPGGEPTDLRITLDASPIPAQVVEPVTFSGSIENLSSETAHAVNLVLQVNEGISLPGVVPEDSGDSQWVVPVGDLSSGERYEFSVNGTPTALTTLVASATATLQTLDLDYSNNQDVIVFNAGFESAPNSVNVFEMLCNGAVYDPLNEWIIVTTQDTADDGIANQLLAIDPLTGLIERAVALPGEGTQIRLSDDSSVLYVLSQTRSNAYRINWPVGTVEESISFGDRRVDDFEILSSASNTLVVAGGNRGVTIYDGEIARPQPTGTYNGSLIELLPEPNLLFAFNDEHTGFESFKFEITESGLQTLVEKGNLFSGFNKTMKADGYHVYDSRGMVVRADLMSVSGSFDLTRMSPSASSVEPERALQRVYFAGQKTIASCDAESLLLVRQIEFPDLPANIETLERWGDDGFASVLSNGSLAIVRTDLVPESAAEIDLLVDLEDGATVVSPDLLVTGSAFTGQGIHSVYVNGVMSSTGNAFANWSASIHLEHGPNLVRVIANAAGSDSEVTEVYTIHYENPARVAELAAASQWLHAATGHSVSEQTLETSDLDQDGMNDLAEFLFGTDPSVPDRAAPDVHTNEDDGMVVSFVHRENSSYSFEVKLSTNLLDWTNADSAITALGVPEPLAEKPGYARSRFSVDTSQASRSFVRITVEGLE